MKMTIEERDELIIKIMAFLKKPSLKTLSKVTVPCENWTCSGCLFYVHSSSVFYCPPPSHCDEDCRAIWERRMRATGEDLKGVAERLSKILAKLIAGDERR